MVIEADVAATEKSVLGSLPSLFPATALIPSCPPIVGFAAMFGTTVIPDLLCKGSGFFLRMKDIPGQVTKIILLAGVICPVLGFQ